MFSKATSSHGQNNLWNRSVESSLEPTTSSASAAAHSTATQQQQIKSRRREFKAVYLTAAFVLPLPVMWFPFMVARSMTASGSTRVDVLNLLEISGGISIFYSCVNWLTFAAVSRSFRRAYREMWEKIRTKYSSNI